MKTYVNKEELIDEITQTAAKFIAEFADIDSTQKDLRPDASEKTPYEVLAYQLGWLDLIKSWDDDEKAGKKVTTPTPGIKWNKLGELYASFYEKFANEDWEESKQLFTRKVVVITKWVSGFSEKELFEDGQRGWASSTPSQWPVYKWIHINTVAPFTNFRAKIRKWKKLVKQTKGFPRRT